MTDIQSYNNKTRNNRTIKKNHEKHTETARLSSNQTNKNSTDLYQNNNSFNNSVKKVKQFNFCWISFCFLFVLSFSAFESDVSAYRQQFSSSVTSAKQSAKQSANQIAQTAQQSKSKVQSAAKSAYSDVQYEVKQQGQKAQQMVMDVRKIHRNTNQTQKQFKRFVIRIMIMLFS